jgi:hypothetical protein
VADALEAYLTNLGLRRGPLAVARVRTHVKPVARLGGTLNFYYREAA